jgi:peptide/nickel transport system permease protein
MRARISGLVSRTNWSLALGSLIVLLIAVVVVVGPELAPHDPAEENAIIKVGDEWKIPPFGVLSVPGFPLGSDEFGRDLLSRLLWAVRPTMTMVAIVAVVRLVLGVLIGLCAGWFTGWVGRALDGLIGVFLSIPVLMVALGAIAAVGIEAGLKAFIIGLSINGWVETAQLVREQTRIIKNQLYIEAARALGASDSQILLGHALRQIMPMVWMLFAFEISGTLMIAAALGFLGYYIGGDVWVTVTDTVGRRISRTPELGQMLATTWVQIDKPWGMIAVGSVIFIMVMGFNLLGRGLRQRMSLRGLPSHTRLRRARETFSLKVTEPISLWTEARVWQPLSAWASANSRPLGVIGLGILILGSSLLAWKAITNQQAQEALAEASVPEGHFWMAERRDAQGTLWSQSAGTITPEIQWTFEDPAGFSGGPAVSEKGIVYVTSNQGTLYALDPAGNVHWQAALDHGAVGTPAIDAQGRIYVTDKAGNLSAFGPQGGLQWRFEAQEDDFATSGPVIASDGTVYYVLRGHTVQAVSATGQGLWQTRALSQPTYAPPRLSVDGAWLFVKNVALDAQDGSLLEWDASLEIDQYLVGADGESYLQSGNDIVRWQLAGSSLEAAHRTTWDYRQFTVRAEGGPTDAGVTPQQLIWLLYSSNREDTRIVWLKTNGDMAGNIHYAQRVTQVIAVDRDATTYACGQNRMGGGMECMALAPASDSPLWQVSLGQGSTIAGGARVPGRLYVTLDTGTMYAIGEGQEPLEIAGQESAPTAEPEPTSIAPSEEVAWTFQAPAGFSSGPAALPDGNVYIASKDGTLYALDASGNPLWEVTLPAAPVAYPTLDAEGNVYLSDKAGNLSSFAPDGSLRWRFEPPESKPSTVRPLVAPDGTVYYTVGSSVQAVSADGEGLWQTRSKTFRPSTPLQLTASGDMLFYADDAFDTRDGTLLELESSVEVDQFIAGNDGQNYLRAEHTVMQWQRNGSSVEIVQSAQWNYDGVVNQQAPPQGAGVTQEQVIWISYYGAATLAWVDLSGQILGTVHGNVFGDLPIAVIDEDATLYVCGTARRSSRCGAFSPGSEEAVWQVELEGGEPVGGVLIPQRLYVATEEGLLYAVGEGGRSIVGESTPSESATMPARMGPDSTEIAWTFQDPEGFFSGPVTSADGTVYVASNDALYALDASGNPLWEALLPEIPVAYPALDAGGNVYLSDKAGNLSSFAPDGSLRWRFDPPESKPSTVGPLVAPDGTVYYTVGSQVQAVSASGEGLWQTRSKTFRTRTPLQLSAAGDLLFYADDIFDTRDGTLLELESQVDATQYLTGDDGQNYLRAEHTVIQWQRAGSNVEIIQSAQWNYAGFVTSDLSPFGVGVTSQGVIWLMYTHTRIPISVAWVDLAGQILGTARSQVSNGQVVGVLDQDATIYACGMTNPLSDTPTPYCMAFVPGAEEPTWQVELETSREITGGALGPGRLYVSTKEGTLYAIGAAQRVAQAQPAAPVSETPTVPTTEDEGDTQAVPVETPVPTTGTLPPTTGTLPPTTGTLPPTTGTLIAGEALTYTLSVSNEGPSHARNVVVSDTLPAGVSFVGASSSRGSGCAESGGVVTCVLGDLLEGDGATITITLRTHPITSGTITLSHVAAVASQATDPNPSNNQVERQTTLQAGADLAVIQSTWPDPAVAGTPLTYTWSIANHGPAGATGVTASGTLSTSVTLVSTTSSQGRGCNVIEQDTHGTTITCDLGDLVSGNTATVTILVSVSPATKGVLGGSIAVEAHETDPDPSNNVVDTEIPVNVEADLTVTE